MHRTRPPTSDPEGEAQSAQHQRARSAQSAAQSHHGHGAVRGHRGPALRQSRDYVNSTTKLVSLQTVNPQPRRVQIPERFAESVHRGSNREVQRGPRSPAHVRRRGDFVDPVVQLPGRTVLVKARVPNESRQLRPGMFVEAHLVTAVRPMPSSCRRRPSSPSGRDLWYVRGERQGGAARVGGSACGRRFRRSHARREPGDQVVVGGLEMLGNGMPVMGASFSAGPDGNARHRPPLVRSRAARRFFPGVSLRYRNRGKAHATAHRVGPRLAHC